MNKNLLIVLFLLISTFLFKTFSPPPIFAHPGNTAADGCHYCRTNCAKWGEVEGARHCHGGSAAAEDPAPVYFAPVPTTRPTAVPTARPTARPTVIATPRATVKPATCSATSDSVCPARCTPGNDADCCTGKLRNHSWYDNWGCYPTKLSCSAALDNVCDSYCTAGNDHDCCLQKEGYTWYDNWGCYPIQ